MIKKLFILLTLTLSLNSFAEQKSAFKLEGLEGVVVQLLDKSDIISNKAEIKLTTDTKLKLKSAGLKIKSNPAEYKKILLIKLNAIKGFSSDRIMAQIALLEEVEINRDSNIDAIAVTYLDESFFKSSSNDKKVYEVVIDNLLSKFINQYMTENEG